MECRLSHAAIHGVIMVSMSIRNGMHFVSDYTADVVSLPRCSTAVSFAVLHKAVPVAAAVVEFAGGPTAWVTRTYTASQGGGAQCNGKDLQVTQTLDVTQSLLVCFCQFHSNTSSLALHVASAAPCNTVDMYISTWC